MKNGICPKCSSTDIIPRVRIIDRVDPWSDWHDRELQVEVQESPDAVIFKGKHRETLRAWICGECGFTELFVSSPRALFATYRESGAKDERTLKLD